MTNKLVVIINSLKVPKIKKILLYEMKFLVPNYSCLQNPWLRGCRPQIPVLSVLNWICWTPPLPEQNSWVPHWQLLRSFFNWHQSNMIHGYEQRNVKRTINADSHTACRSHATPMPFPCHAVPLRVKNVSFPFTQCGRFWFARSEPLAARHGRGTAWARHGNGMLCVNRP